MTVSASVTPLYGSDGTAVCCLLKVGCVQILLDCGWDERFDRQLLEPLLNIAPKLDLVLLSQPDLAHLGALPALLAHDAGVSAPVYAAAPIVKLGQILFHDCFASQWAVSDFSTFSADDIDAAFKRIKTLKHHQLLELELQGSRFRLVGYPSGHMIGGTVWTIETGGEVLVYAPATNHSKERHLRGGQLSTVPMRPALLVCGPGSKGGKGGPTSRKERDSTLLAALREVFTRGGNVLLPVDSSGRLLEVLLVLDQLWHQHKFVYHLGLLSYVADSAVRAAAGCLEWLSDELQREFNAASINPLACRYVKRCHNVGDVARMGEGSKVVIATGLSLECGLSRELLVKWGGDGRNGVIFTQQPPAGSLGHRLLQLSDAARPVMLSLTIGHREPLTGPELEEFEARRAEAAAAEEEAEAAAAAAAAAGAAAAAAAAAAGAGDAFGALAMRESCEAIRQLRRNAVGELEQVLGDQQMSVGFEEGVLVDEGILMEGFGPPPGATYCMFPDEQELLLQDWDQFGAVMDTSALRQEEAEMEQAGVADEDEMDLEEQGPTKVVQDMVQLPFAAAVSLLEGFVGLSDPASLATILAEISPRSLLLLGGSGSTADMAAVCAGKLNKEQTRVIQSGPGQEVGLRLASSYRLSLSQGLLDSLSRHRLGVYDVAWLDGTLAAAAVAPSAAAPGDAAAEGAGAEGQAAAADGAAAAGTKQQQGQEQGQQQQQKQRPTVHWSDEEQLFVLVPPSAAGAAGGAAAAAADDEDGAMSMDLGHAGSVVSDLGVAAVAAAVAANGLAGADAAAAAAAAGDDHRVGDHGGIFIGDVKLSEVKAALAKVGIPANFQAGRLLVRGGLVVSREGGEGGLLVEGPLCEDYFRVRDTVYGLYNIC